MTYDLVQAYHGVYTSSGEIIKNKQRHLYVNMLDLLTKTTRASGVSSSNLFKDQYVKFWYTEILSLVFDEDTTIHENAIAAFETVLPYLEAVEFCNAPEWPGIKATIVEQYSLKLHNLREASNSNWYKIWCLLVRILNKEILKGASIINTFLQIVELGFRSSNYNIRAEAFLCWKVLVEIFAKHDEICSPKRIKLICIPLKSSQSKTVETSVNKFKVWWFFICKLSSKIEDYLDTIYEPFLVFCFGPTCKQQPTLLSAATIAQGKMYMIVRKMAIACLIESLGPSSQEAVSIMSSVGLELTTIPLINKNIMSKCGKIIINACFEATLMAKEPGGSNHGKQIELLWKNLHRRLIETQDLELYRECFKQLNVMSRTEQFQSDNLLLQQHILYIIKLLADPKEFPFTNEVNEISKFSEILNLVTEIIANSNIKVPQAMVNDITEIYSLKNLLKTAKYWLVQKNVMQFLLNNSSVQKIVKINLWKSISHSLAEYLHQNFFEFRIKENAKLVNDWILWPFQWNLLGTNQSILNEEFFISWKNLMEAASSAEGKFEFTQSLAVSLRSIFDSEIRNPHFPIVLDYLITTLDNSFDVSSKPTIAFELINYILSVPGKMDKGSYTKVIESITRYIAKIGDNQVIEAFKELKTIFSTLIEKESCNAFDKHAVDDFKRTFQDKLKSNKAKEKKLLKEIKDLMKNDSMFVIIPTVWGMNPDKLTDHQKEKMQEKRNDIPALYNDMSQSQDASIKPWTPKKIVIAKHKDSREIVIENRNEQHTVVSTAETENDVTANLDHRELPSETDQEINSLSEKNPPKQSNMDDDQSHSKIDKIMKDICQKTNSNNEKLTKKDLKTNECENLLNKLNIQVDDEEKKLSLLRQLKSIEIDTVEGNTLVQGKLRERRTLGKSNSTENKRGKTKLTSKRPRTSNHNKSTKIESVKCAKFENEEPKASNQEKFPDCNNSSDEIIEASQMSESVLTKKIFKKKPIAPNNRSDPPVKNSINELKEGESVKTSSLSFTEKEIHGITNNEEVSEFITSENNNIDPIIPINGNHESISEMDTQLNTEPMDNSTLNGTTKAISIIATTERSPNQIDQLSTAIVLDESVAVNAATENQNSSISNMNHSIRSSSECNEVEERIAEFMNNTLDISPILNRNNDSHRNGNIGQDKTPTSPVSGKSTNALTQLQLSPPERKPTNNFESPAHRPKVPPQFTGRGAKLINLIRNKRTVECTPKLQAALMTAKAEEKMMVENASQGQYPQQISPKNEQQQTKLHKDLLVFSKILPSPHASPSASILKRKLRRDSFDDIESPMSKRKRVSFHDPPVSITKEYLKHAEEDKVGKPSFNRCLLPDRSSTPNNMNNFKNNQFKRRSRVDSMMELAKFSDLPVQQINDIDLIGSKQNIQFGQTSVEMDSPKCNTTREFNDRTKLSDLPVQINEIDLAIASKQNIQFGQTSVEMDSLKWNTTRELNDRTEIDEACITSSPPLYFSDDNAVLKYVLEKYSFEKIFEKYSHDEGLTNKSIRAVTKELSSLMSKDCKIKSNVLEMLSEEHPKEFLEHAVQENLSIVVCERLNFTSIVEFICEKSKLNEDNRRILVERIQNFFSSDKLNADARQLIVSLLKNHSMTDQEIVSCMEIIVSRHRQNKITLVES